MFFPRKRALVASIALCTAGFLTSFGYVLSGTSWPNGSTILMHLELGATNVHLQDGLGTWNGSAADALALWNQHLVKARFNWVNNSTAPKGAHNGNNTVSFSSTVYGESFGHDTLAVTVGWSSSSNSSVTTEADVLVNNVKHFNSYRGPLQGNLFDFHRVMLHEFGHVLGLKHPDEAGQYVTAIMNSVTSYLDALAQDDIDGAIFLYGYRITSSLEFLTVVRGDPFTYQIAANNNPISFSAVGLPPGLALNRSSGLISGRPTHDGVYEVMLTAHGAPGDALAAIHIDVMPPQITNRDWISYLDSGDQISLQITTDRPFSSFDAGGLPPGVSINRQTGLISGIATVAGDYSAYVTANNATAGQIYQYFDFHIQTAPPQLVKSFQFAVNRLLVDESRKRVYATLPNTSAVAVIDATNLSLIKTVPVQSEPQGMAISLDGTKLFVARNADSDSTIEVIDLDTLTRVPGLPAPFASRDVEAGLSGRLFVASTQSRAGAEVIQMDSQTGTLLAPLPNGLRTGQLEISPDRKTLYIGATGFTPPSLTALDVSSSSPVVREQAPADTVQNGLLDFKLTHNGRFLFPVEGNSGRLLKISGGDLTHTSGQIPLRSGFNVTGPIALSPRDDTVFIQSDAPPTAGYRPSFGVFSTVSLRYLRAIETNSFRPSDMVVDPSGRFLFAGSREFKNLRIFFTGLSAAPSVTPNPHSLLNVSTRLKTQLGDDALIGGFIISGLDPKKVAIRAIGPSLPVSGKLDDPVLELRNHAGALVATNDNWNLQRADVMLTGLPPANDHESVIIATLEPGNYTTILRGVQSTSGVALVEVYDLSSNSNSKLANISTRGKVETGDNVMIGGFIIGGGQPTKVIVRAIGPSLANAGVQGALQDPVLELHGRDGSLIFQNDNWRTNQQADIIATRIPPTDNRESAIVATLKPGNYTAIVRGKNNTTGVALVEVYNLETN